VTAIEDEAERVLGLTFPPSYRRFLEQLAGTMHFTLQDRQDADLPPAMLVHQYDGMGGTYVLDTSRPDETGEAPARAIAADLADPGA
jgi:hypothetical protein